jgi:predicted alpha/beta-fold hydrolase
MKNTCLPFVFAAFALLCSQRAIAFTPNANSGSKLVTDSSTKRNFIEEARKQVIGAFTERLRVSDRLKVSIPVPDLKIVTERRLRDLQKRGIPIASSFIPSDYNPHPLLQNRHLQTILGVFIRDEPGVAYIQKSNVFQEIFPVGKAILSALPSVIGKKDTESECDFWDQRVRFETPDNDFFHVDYKYQNPEIEGGGEGMVVIIHGLESNSNSTLCQNMARAYAENNMDVACVNFRGCGGNPNDSILQYHGGWTQDMLLFLDKWAEGNKEKKRPMYITGFSLGANVAMKLLGDLSMDAVDKYNIRGAAVSGAPFDLVFHWRQLIDVEFNRIVYAGSMLKSMKRKTQYITDRFLEGNTETDVFDYWKCMNATTIAEIEDGMIAPIYGFKDRFEYYEKSASLPVIDKIAVPTFVINAGDDPFFNPDHFPWEKDCEAGGVAPLKLTRTEKGGHLGHLFHRIENEDERPASFAPMELARFLEHVHSSNKSMAGL